MFLRRPSLANAKAIAKAALLQDAPHDITSDACIGAKARCTARIVAKSDFVLCGKEEAASVFGGMKVRAKWEFEEGQKVARGNTVCSLSGQARRILACERVALNYLMLLSGIATKSGAACEKYGRWKIAATRKTLPNLADSCKRAVLLGGCLTHRMGLADGILVKDNHIGAIMEGAGVSRLDAILLAVSSFPRGAFVEVEVSSASEAVAAAKGGAKAVLADNVSPGKLARMARAARGINPRIVVEASGGITLANAGKYLAAGADFVSTSELTMKIEPADLSLEIDF